MKIWIVSATETEFSIARNAYKESQFNSQHTIEWLHVGVGIVPTVFNLMQHLKSEKPDLIINVGIAGAIDKSLQLCESVLVLRDEFYQWGAEDKDSFIDIFSLGFVQANEKPFKEGRIYASVDYFQEKTGALKKVNGITVQKVHGNILSISELHTICTDVHTESMEGAAVFYVAGMLDIPVIQLRTISNYVEPRNRAAWKIQEAIQVLNDLLISILKD
jgi:futalosine hydrolase